NEVKRASDETIDRLNMIQRDDGELARVVGPDQLKEPLFTEFQDLSDAAAQSAADAAHSASDAQTSATDAEASAQSAEATRQAAETLVEGFDGVVSEATDELETAKTGALGELDT